MANVSLINNSEYNVDLEYLDDILNLVNLPSGRIDLVFSAIPLIYKQGVCISSRLLRFCPDYIDLCRDVREWDCCILISSSSYRFISKYPCYFTYLIAHEMGHAKICLADLSIHIFNCLVQDSIYDASNKVVSLEHQIPHERILDEYGLYIASQIHSKEQVYNELHEMLEDPKCKNDQVRLGAMEELEPQDRILAIHSEMIQFALPYKEKLIELWKDDYLEEKENSLASFVYDQEYDPLFILNSK